MLIDFVNKALQNSKNIGSVDISDASMNIMKTLPLLKNIQEDEKDKTSSIVDNRFFYTGFDWTLNLLPTIILIKLAFIGGFAKYVG